MSDGKATGWIRGATLPPVRAIREPAELRAICQATYGVPAESIDADFLKLLKTTKEETSSDFDDSAIGRRKR